MRTSLERSRRGELLICFLNGISKSKGALFHDETGRGLFASSLFVSPFLPLFLHLIIPFLAAFSIGQRMVNFMLEIKGDLENLTNLQPQGGCNDPDFPYYFKLKCGNCGELSQKETCVTLSEVVQLPKGKGTTNLSQRCKFCGRDGSVLMIPGRGRAVTDEDSESGKFVPIMMFDCRGFEPTGFSFRDGWTAESLSGTKFESIDLSDGDFVEYDEKGQCPVGVSNLQERFVVVK